MLALLQKYQKTLFIVIATVVILSFTVVGGYSSLSSFSQTTPEKAVCQDVYGKDLWGSDLEKLELFLTAPMNETGASWNQEWLIDSFFKTGLLNMFYEEFKQELEPIFKEKWKKAVLYRPYKHPEDPSLSAEAVWSIFAPQKSSLLKEFQKKPSFSLYVQLFLEEKKFSPEFLQRAFFYRISQMPHLSIDRSLFERGFHLFHHRNLEDWFSRKFFRMLSAFVYNLSEIAKEKGFVVSLSQAKADFSKKNQGPQSQQNRMGFIRFFGSQQEAVQVWQRLLLAQRLLEGTKDHLGMDSLTAKALHQYFDKEVQVEEYVLQTDLSMQSNEDFVLGNLYLSQVAEGTKEVPKQKLSVEQIEKKSPHLIAYPYRLHKQTLTQQEKELEIAEKDLWKWQCQADSFTKLCQKFSQIPTQASSEKQRFQILCALHPSLREEMDAYSRSLMVQEDPKYENRAWQKQPLQKEVVEVSSDYCSLSSVQDPHKFLLFVQELQLDKPQVYQEKNTSYRITLKEALPKRVFSFDEVKSFHLMHKEWDDLLQQTFDHQRKISPKQYQNAKGKFLSLDEAKEKLTQHLVKQFFSSYSQVPNSSYRFAAFMEENLQRKKENQDLMTNPFLSIEKSLKSYTRETLPEKAFFSLKEQQWSTLYINQNHQLAFCQLKKKSFSDKKGFLENMWNKEAKEIRMQACIKLMKEKKAYPADTYARDS